MRVAVAKHDEVVRHAIETHRGYVFATGGDGFGAAFERAVDAVAAAEQAQGVLADLGEVAVRMALNTGEVHERDGDYFGPAVNRTARLMAAGHGGQVLISGVTAELVPGLVLRNLGEHRLRDLGSPCSSGSSAQESSRRSGPWTNCPATCRSSAPASSAGPMR